MAEQPSPDSSPETFRVRPKPLKKWPDYKFPVIAYAGPDEIWPDTTEPELKKHPLAHSSDHSSHTPPDQADQADQANQADQADQADSGSVDSLPQLPIEMLEEIFSNLSVRDQLKVQEVCKVYKFAAREALKRINRIGPELVVKEYQFSEVDDLVAAGYHRNHRWYLTNEFAHQATFVPRFPAHLEQFKRLRIAMNRFKMSDLPNIARSCGQLEHLEIDRLSFDCDTSMTLELRHLKVLRIRTSWRCYIRRIGGKESPEVKPVSGVRLTFDSDKLSTLCFGDHDVFEHVAVSRPELVTHLEFDLFDKNIFLSAPYRPLPMHDMLGARQFANLETVICLACPHLIHLDNRHSTLDYLLELNTLRELHLFLKGAGGFPCLLAEKRSETFFSLREVERWIGGPSLEEVARYIRGRGVAEREPPLRVWIQGVTLERVLDPQTGISTLPDTASMLQLHFRNRDHLARSFPHCTNLLFDRPFLFLFAADLNLPGGRTLGSTYTHVKELRIVLSSLVPKLLLKLPGLCDYKRELYNVLMRLYPGATPEAAEGQLAEHFADIEEQRDRIVKPRLIEADSSAIAQSAQWRPTETIIQFRRDVLTYLREHEPELYERAEKWVLEFIKSFQHLAYLNLSYNGLSQSFYEKLSKLPSLTESLNQLRLFEESGNKATITNLSFLLAFKRLHFLATNMFPRSSLSEPLILEIIQTMEYPAYCELYFNHPRDVIRIAKFWYRPDPRQKVFKTRYHFWPTWWNIRMARIRVNKLIEVLHYESTAEFDQEDMPHVFQLPEDRDD